MAKTLLIAVDAMGGDHAPDAIIEGVAAVAQQLGHVQFELHGDPDRIAPLTTKFGLSGHRYDIVPSTHAIAMDTKPSQALRQGKGSSMWNACSAVEVGRAQAVVSAGNTGALMAISKLRLRMVEGINRPALVANWPSKRGATAVLDVGATVEASASQLVEFAIMGEAYFRANFGTQQPTIGLLNIGSEDQKGREEIKEAARLLRELDLGLGFQGFVEGHDISAGVVDVVVTDGYTGNVALKTAEGTARLVSSFLKEALGGSVLGRIGALIAYPALKKLKARMDPGGVNGGVFLGLNGLVVKSHGGTDGPGFATAVRLAARMAESPYRQEVAANVQRFVAMQAGAGLAPVEDTALRQVP